MASIPYFLNRIESQRVRAKGLTTLREIIALSPDRDLKREQWEALDSQLTAVSNRLLNKLRIITDRFLSDRHNPELRARLVSGLGDLEMEITQAYVFYDTFMDLLTQRLSKHVGDMLLGCDVIAADGLARGFLADVTVAPVVYCNQGYGASICRDGVHIIPGVPNPVPVIAIPYARLMEKYNLISVYHEVGHQALSKLNLVNLIGQIFQEQMRKAGAPALVCNLFANWSRELAPDFWAFCLTGMAQTSSMRDILSLSNEMTTHISTSQPHPPGYLRFLASVHWCRYMWGKGDWDNWEAEWKKLYPLEGLDKITRETLETSEKLLPVAARIFFETRFTKLDRKPIASLFHLDNLQPAKLKALATVSVVQSRAFSANPIGVQLAAFGLLREKRAMKLLDIDQVMNAWLKNLNHQTVNS